MMKQRSDIDYKKNQGDAISKALSNPETKKKMSESIKKTRTEDFNKRLSDIMRSPEMNNHLSQKSKDLWQTKEYRNKLEMTDDKKEKISNSVTELWKNKEYRDKVTAIQNDEEVNAKRSNSIKNTVNKEDYLNEWYRQVEAKNVLTNEILIFKNIKIANKWIKDNKKMTKKRF